ncbi:group III truncated hemoglobin [Acuticoccus sp. M5D2P5]|uniref:group III truncated hemoglobin n=1 Tax=Acuticoccus kalidii TaxID=2910977 RepID=UPI001F3AB702|nr:group III truncated hemoglobin [Acuticoccus kalidii]MCF3933327.1 group III truncated hemoglobin [Acuticoccus kalidii]
MIGDEAKAQISSARPRMTATVMEQTALDEDVLHRLVDRFYGKVRADPMLGPIFEARVADWDRHLERMVDFWSSVALMTGRYHGQPVPAHVPLPVDASHFNHWLDLFRETAREVSTPAGAEHLIERAERIARSLHIAVELGKAPPGAVPTFPPPLRGSGDA